MMENMIILGSGQKIDVVFQDHVTLDIDCTLRYIKSGEAEINSYVINTAQPQLNQVISTAQTNMATAIAKGIEDASLAAESAAASAIDQSIDHAETAISDYVDASITPILEQHVATAANSASSAATSANSADASATNAALSADAATASASASLNSANAASAAESRINNVINNAADEIFALLNDPFSLLDYKYSEYELSNASWLLSNGQWNSGAVYQSVYDLLLQIYNGTTTKAGVSVKLSTETYADTDFVLNTTDTTFRLPLKVALASGKAVVNNETSANGLYLYFYVGEVVQDANIIAAAGVLTDVADLKNASNFSQTGLSTLSGLGMPSDRYDSLTIGASGATYTAPANGYFVGWCGGNGYLTIEAYDVFGMSFFSGAQSGISGGRGYLPVKKGTQVKVYHSSLQSLRFYYAEGEN